MKVIDLLFNGIDELNSKIKSEENTYRKVLIAFEIAEIVEIIKKVESIQCESYLPTYERGGQKEYF